ncbi:MAG: exo-alpha-sialidase [Phycisphaerae bacterium]|nr:exo-alpha-sialidase [Phycisphaerae bacterium]
MPLAHLKMAVVGSMLLGALFARGAFAAGGPERAGLVTATGEPAHKEEVRDEHQPGPIIPSVAPAPHRATWACGPYTSVQVNVDIWGNNVPGDAANEPSLAIDPTDPNRMAIGWRQFDTIASNFRQAGWAYSHDGGKTWAFPGTLEPGVFRSDPVLAADPDGNFFYNSLTVVGNAFYCNVFKSTNGGVSWNNGVYAFGGDKAWMAIDTTNGIGRGNIYCSWSYGSACCGYNTFNRSTDGGQTFSQPIPVPLRPTFGTLAVGADGELFIAGVHSPSYSRLFTLARSSNAQDPTATVEFEFSTELSMGGRLGGSNGPNPGGLLGQVWIACDHSDGPGRGNVYMLCSVNPDDDYHDPLDIMFIRSTDRGETWSDPIRVNDDPEDNRAWQWFGTMSVAPTGRIDAIWNDTRNDPACTYSELYYSFSEDGGLSWSENRPVSLPFNHFLGYPNQPKLGDYYDMISDELGASVAYAATFNGEQDVYFLRIGTFDCNDNGIHDAQDLAAGTSADCNSNGTPDECEPDEDCNENGVQDICDIAAGTSIDCQPNNIPDECEVDCNTNSVPDDCDISAGTSRDCNTNGIPDECEVDCNDNGVPDDCDIAAGTSDDCQPNHVPDECDIAAGTSRDCLPNSVPDECEVDCNTNGIPDECDIAVGTSNDCNDNNRPDECDVPRCTYRLWGGFNDFPKNTRLNGFNEIPYHNGDLSYWRNPAGTAKIYWQGCEGGGFTDRAAQISVPGGSGTWEDWHLTSEYFSSYHGVLPPDEPIYSLRFRARFDLNLNPGTDWQFSIHDATNDESVIVIRFSSGASWILPGSIVVENPPGQYIDTGVMLEQGVCYEIEVVLNNDDDLVTVYVDGDPLVVTLLASNARRMDYFRVETVNNGSGSMAVATLKLDHFDLCLTGGVSVPPQDIPDCNDNLVLDECDIASGTSTDFNQNGIPDECDLCGDLDGDGDVDAADYQLFLRAFGSGVGQDEYLPLADLDGDGVVTLVDYQMWMQCYRDSGKL